METESEWYVMMTGYGSLWRPSLVIQGRLKALARFTEGFPVTPEETRRLRIFHVMRPGPEVGEGMLLVGHFDKGGRRVDDRMLVRVEGP